MMLSVEKPKTEKANKVPIFLSTSVGIGESQAFFGPAPKIEIAYDLEETYRPRYKSDYFAQNGRNRKPRYVTDRLGNHYVTLKVISTFVQKLIRIKRCSRYLLAFAVKFESIGLQF